MKRGTLMLLVLGLVAVVIIVVITSIFHNGLSARATPTVLRK